MKPGFLFLLCLLAALLASCSDSDGSDVHVGAPAEFAFVEGTIAQAHAAMRSGTLSCEALVQGYIDRIEAYDRAGPKLRSVIRINPQALERADTLDAQFAYGGLTGPLHCVPVLLKDNFDTADLYTTAGGLALETSQSPGDAFSVQGIVNVGGSVRVLQSVEGLVGIRPSLRRVNQDGIVPLVAAQPTAGPMCRTVEDCALMLEAMIGFDDGSYSNKRESLPTTMPI